MLTHEHEPPGTRMLGLILGMLATFATSVFRRILQRGSHRQRGSPPITIKVGSGQSIKITTGPQGALRIEVGRESTKRRAAKTQQQPLLLPPAK
jgi:hypothetical protein